MPGENFLQFRQCTSLAKIYSTNFFAHKKFWLTEIFPHVDILHVFSLVQSAVVPDNESLFFLDLWTGITTEQLKRLWSELWPSAIVEADTAL